MQNWKKSLATLFPRGDSLIFHLWPLLLNPGSPRMSLDLVWDASEVAGCVVLHLSNHVPFGVVTSSISLPGIATNHLHPFFFFSPFFFFKVKLSLKSVDYSEVQGQIQGVQGFRPFLRLRQTPSLALYRSFQFSPLLLSHLLKSG